MSKFTVRIRHSKGTTRIELPNKSSTTIKQLKQLISEQLSYKPSPSTQQLTINGKQSDTPLTNNLILSSLNISHGHMFYLKIVSSAIVCQSNNNNKNTNKRSRKRKLNETNTSNAPPKKRTRLNNNNTNKKKGKKKKKTNEFLIIKSEGNNIDEIVNNYFSIANELEIALKLLPIDTQKLYVSDGRIESILDEKVQINEHLEQSQFTSKAKSRGKRHLIVMYSYKRKKRKEMVCFYDDEKIKQIIKNIIKKEEIFIKSKINHQNIIELIAKSKLTLHEIGNRSPPLLWSLVHSFPNKQVDKVIEEFVKNAWKELRQEMTQQINK